MSEALQETSSNDEGSSKRWIGFIYVGGLLLMFVLWQIGAIEALEKWLNDAGQWAYIAYVLIYVSISLFWVPVMWLNILSGALFGPWVGAAMVMLSTLLAATIAFFLSRYWLDRERLMSKIPEKAGWVQKALEHEKTWLTVLLLRLSNVAPFAGVNYLSGILRINYPTYLLSTAAGSLPGTLVWSGLGSLLITGLRQTGS
jgi:uncharacterized membrane protein YdjX (TVP38/TMEM64 family)